MQSLLIISRCGPWSGPSAREALDIALAGGAFELPVSMLFLDDGVFQLLDGQRPAGIEQKNLAANLQALPLFGIESLYVAQSSLDQRELSDAPLAVPAKPLDNPGIVALIADHDQVITI